MVSNEMEDFDLLEKFNNGDEEAFALIVARHSAPLINFLFRYTQNTSLSEDIAQEAFLRIYRSAGKLKPDAKLSTILYKIAYNLAIDAARKKKSRDRLLHVESLDAMAGGNESPAKGEDNPDDLYEASQRAGIINSALAELPESQRTAVLLKTFENRSYAEIAEIMGTSVSSVESLLFRARQSMIKKLK